MEYNTPEMKALFIDLDNTIYPAAPIGRELFTPVWKRIAISGQHDDELQLIQETMLQRPFQAVAELFDFSEELTHSCLVLLNQLEVRMPLTPFEGYRHIRALDLPKFLVTPGFTKLQNSKIDRLGIRADFEEIHIVDPTTGPVTKKAVLEEVTNRKGWTYNEVFVLGDDPNSELKAAKELEIPHLQLRYAEHILPHDGQIVHSLEEAALFISRQTAPGEFDRAIA